MPPKGKVNIDKSFGMKNKKGAKGQEQVKVLKQQAQLKGKTPDDVRKDEMKAAAKKAKEQEILMAKMEAALNKPLAPQKVPVGVDPKTVLCQYYKAGHCEKGNKCKFSHDKDVGRKVEKRNLYVDDREGGPSVDKSKDTMETWDEEKLRSVVLSKAGNPKTTTDIVCKFFIQAVEDQKYGWFWDCPNGVDCMYKHSLPPGFVLDSDKKKKAAADKAQTITLEEFLESERHKLKAPLTPVTPESFALWKKTRMDKKQAEEEAATKLKETAGAMGKLKGLSGREMFSFNPDMFEDEEEDDEDAWDLENYRQAENAFSDNDDDAEGAADKLALLDVDGEDEDESEAPSAGEVDLEGVGGQSKGKEKAQ